MAAVEATGLVKTFKTRKNAVKALDGIDLEIPEGTVLGLLGPNLIAVHCVHLEAGEIRLLAHHGCSVVHCPSSNLKLASGFAPIAALMKEKVNVALGTDGAASNGIAIMLRREPSWLSRSAIHRRRKSGWRRMLMRRP